VVPMGHVPARGVGLLFAEREMQSMQIGMRGGGRELGHEEAACWRVVRQVSATLWWAMGPEVAMMLCPLRWTSEGGEVSGALSVGARGDILLC